MAMDEEIIGFDRHDPAEVVEAMGALAARGDGEGWINLVPSLDQGQAMRVPTRSGLMAWFSGRGPAVAMSTWTPPAAGDRPRPAQIGVEHGTGPNGIRRLAELGLDLPPDWNKRQDHAKHGIVVDLPGDADAKVVVGWLVDAAALLMTVVDAGDGWTAVVHRSR